MSLFGRTELARSCQSGSASGILLPTCCFQGRSDPSVFNSFPIGPLSACTEGMMAFPVVDPALLAQGFRSNPQSGQSATLAGTDTFQALLALLAPNLVDQARSEPIEEAGTEETSPVVLTGLDQDSEPADEEDDTARWNQELPFANIMHDVRPWVFERKVAPVSGLGARDLTTPVDAQPLERSGGLAEASPERLVGTDGTPPEDSIVPDRDPRLPRPEPEEPSAESQPPVGKPEHPTTQPQVAHPPLPDRVTPQESTAPQPRSDLENPSSPLTTKSQMPTKAVDHGSGDSGMQAGRANRNARQAENSQPMAFAMDLSPEHQSLPPKKAVDPAPLPALGSPLPVPTEASPPIAEGYSPPQDEPSKLQFLNRSLPGPDDQSVATNASKPSMSTRHPVERTRDLQVEMPVEGSADPIVPALPTETLRTKAVSGTQFAESQGQESETGARPRNQDDDHSSNHGDQRHTAATGSATLATSGIGSPSKPAPAPLLDRSPDQAASSADALPAVETPRKDLAAETRSLRIPLEPLGAGPIEIRLAQSASGVQVRVHAAHGETRQVLQDNLTELVGNLRTQGFETHQVSLPNDATVPLPAEAIDAVHNSRPPGEAFSQERISSPDYQEIALPNPDQTSYDSHPDRQNQSWREANKRRKGQSKPASGTTKEASWLLSRV